MSRRLRGAAALFAAVAFLLYPVSAYAEKCEKVVPLKASELSPCSGLLWPEPYTKTALSCLKVDVPRLEGLIERLKLEHAAELKSLNVKLVATEKSLIETEDLLREAAAIDPDPWYKSPYLWTSIGLVVGIGLTVGAVKLAGELR